MHTGSEPGNFESYPVETVDVWEPIRAGGGNSDIQSFEAQAIYNVGDTEKVDAWEKVSDEAIRRTIVHRIMRLLDAWVISGLIVFIVTGNVWLLTTAGLLGLLLQRIFDYYFRRPKK